MATFNYLHSDKVDSFYSTLLEMIHRTWFLNISSLDHFLSGYVETQGWHVENVQASVAQAEKQTFFIFP